MAKMIDRFLLKIQISRLANLQHKKAFLEAYQPIVLKAKEDHKDSVLKKMQEQNQRLMESYLIRAGVNTSELTAKKTSEMNQIIEAFKWKEKALNQSKKRALVKKSASQVEETFQKKAEILLQKKQASLARIDAKYSAVDANQEVAKTKYLEKKVILDQNFSDKKQQLEEKFLTQSTLLQKRNHLTIEKLDQAILHLQSQTRKHAENAPSSANLLPEGVILRLENLNMRFGGLLAVDNLSFDVKKGEIFGLIGPNGAGKTTIFNCITRFYRPTSGAMIYRKSPVEVILLNDFAVHNIIRQGIVRTFQNVELIWELSILDNLLVAAHTIYRSGFFSQLLHTQKLHREEEVMKNKALGILKTLDLLPFQYMSPLGLPYGILKRVELARTLMANPKLIILDEPAAGLNDLETEALAKIIRRIRDEYDTTIFLVEHDMGLVMELCDTVCAISFGKMLAIGTPAQIQANSLVRSAYLGEE